WIVMGESHDKGKEDDLANRLKGFSLSAAEALVTDIEQVDIRRSAEACRRSLFGKVIGDRRASWIGIKRTMNNIWKLQKPMDIKELEPNYFQFIFQNREDLEKVVSGTNWIYDNQYLILREWEQGLNSLHKGFNELLLWAQVTNLPLDWLSAEVGLKIGKAFPDVKNVLVQNISPHGGKMLKLLVSINLGEPLPRCTNIRLGDQIATVGFQYERLVSLCYYCGVIGHLDKSCKKRLEDIKNQALKEGQYGDWLKTEDIIPGTYASPSSSRQSPFTSQAPATANSNNPSSSTGQIPESPIPISAMKSLQETCPQDTVDSSSEVPELHPSTQLVLSDLATSNQQHSMEIVNSATPIQEKDKLMEIELSLPSISNITPQKITSMQKESFRTHHPLFFFLSETKNNGTYVKSVSRKLGFTDRHYIVDPRGQSGGLLLLWHQDVNIINVVSKDFYIAVNYSLNHEDQGWGVFVYMSTDKRTREAQWMILEEDRYSWGEVWFSIGDWNSICAKEGKKRGRPRKDRSFDGFNKFISNMEMEEIGMEGHQFTWGNNRDTEGYVEEKLDRAFASFEWLSSHPNAKVLNVIRTASDHSLLILNAGSQESRCKRRFAFDRRWISKEGFAEVVQKAWSIPQSGTPFFRLKEKVKQTRIALLIWSSKFKSQNQEKIAALSNKLEEIREAGRADNWEEWNSVSKELKDAYTYEEKFWAQKARVQWLKEGDSNTKFFHAYSMSRRRQNAISRLITDANRVYSSRRDIENHITTYYSSLFSSEGSWGGDSMLHLIPQSISSSAFFSKNTSLTAQNQVCAIMAGIQLHSSTRYLGLPLGIGRSKSEVFSYVLDSVKAKLWSWKNKMISVVGKE
ncbi:Unknown protein, partial [Striga hermonthica]